MLIFILTISRKLQLIKEVGVEPFVAIPILFDVFDADYEDDD